MITLKECVWKVQRKLNDTLAEIWTRDRIKSYVQEGYDALCRDSECIFDMVMFTTEIPVGNHTRDFEVQYMTGPILQRFNFTRESEREFVGPESAGPVMVTRPTDAGSTDETAAQGTKELPDDVVTVSRVTHDWLPLDPEHSRHLRKTKSAYMTLQGGAYQYSMDQDGRRMLRLSGIPAQATAPPAVGGVFGAVRSFDVDNLGSETVMGSYGVIRSVPRHFNSGQYGAVRRVISDEAATRVEMYRLGREIDEEQAFELPDRAIKYVQWYAMYRALSLPGRGENKAMAAHFKARYEAGVERMKTRVRAQMDERTITMGSKRQGERDSYLSMFPSDYGYKIRRRY